MVVDGVIVCAMGVAEEDAAVAVAAGLGEALAAKSELNASRERSRFICRSRSALRASNESASPPMPLPSPPSPPLPASPAASSAQSS